MSKNAEHSVNNLPPLHGPIDAQRVEVISITGVYGEFYARRFVSNLEDGRNKLKTEQITEKQDLESEIKRIKSLIAPFISHESDGQ